MRLEQLQQPQEATALWPENETTVVLFEAMLSQWRASGAGLIGLDYAVLPVVARLPGLPPRALRAAFGGLREMESQALEILEAPRRR